MRALHSKPVILLAAQQAEHVPLGRGARPLRAAGELEDAAQAARSSPAGIALELVA